MPKGEQTLADLVEDRYYADMGVRTGSAYNDLLVHQRQDRINAEMTASRTSGGPSAPLFPAVDAFFARLPMGLKRLALLMAFVLPFGYALRHGYTLPASVAWGGGGMAALAICWGLLIFSIKLAILAVYVAVFVGVAALLYQFFSS